MDGIDLGWREWRPSAFIGGLGLSLIVAVILLTAMYFAGTAPHLPGSADALETLKAGGAWPPSVAVQPLDRPAVNDARAEDDVPAADNVPDRNIEASAENTRLLPRSAERRGEAPPIEISDLPPRAPRLR